MPKVGSSLVDIPVTVNREKVFIMTRFRKRRQIRRVASRTTFALHSRASPQKDQEFSGIKVLRTILTENDGLTRVHHG
jgi:hypothetical protein